MNDRSLCKGEYFTLFVKKNNVKKYFIRIRCPYVVIIIFCVSVYTEGLTPHLFLPNRLPLVRYYSTTLKVHYD